MEGMKDKGPAEDVGDVEQPEKRQQYFYVVLNGKLRGVYRDDSDLEAAGFKEAPMGETPSYRYYRVFTDVGKAQNYYLTTSYVDESSEQRVMYRDPRVFKKTHMFESPKYARDKREGKTVIIMPQPNPNKRFDVVMSFDENVVVMQKDILGDALFAVIDEVMVNALSIIMGSDEEGGWYAHDDKVCFAIYDTGFIKKFHGGKSLTPDLSYFYQRAMDMSIRVLYMPEASMLIPRNDAGRDASEEENKK